MQAVKLPITDEFKKQLGRVGVLLGGTSSEREVSLNSGAAVVAALAEAGVEVVAIDVGTNAITDIKTARVDRVFIALHGAGGEDGRIQALLEYLQIPYTGSGVQASALAMDKLRTKYVWIGIEAKTGMKLSTPDFVVLDEKTNWQNALTELGSEVMVKPVHEGSSIGMARVKTATEFAEAYQKAAHYDSCVIAEKLIIGAEYSIPIVAGEVLPPIKMETHHSFYDYHAKYIAEDTQYQCPCGLSPEKETELKTLALNAFNAVGCAGWGRVDVMADHAGNFYLLEVNTAPGMTSHSLVPMAAKVQGMSFSELVLTILRETLSKELRETLLNDLRETL